MASLIFRRLKIPDFFYLNQYRALTDLHDFSVELLGSFYRKNNPTNAYDSEWGEKRMGMLEAKINCYPVIGERTRLRLLGQRLTPPSFANRPELDRDIFKVETIQVNIEKEMDRLYRKQTTLAATIIFLALVFIIGFLSVSH